MINWQALETTQQIEEIAELSRDTPCLVYKHSTSCGISAMAKKRIENDWEFDETVVVPYYLDILAFRNLSHLVAERFQTTHQSPQVLFIKDGKVVLSAAKFDISVKAVEDLLQAN